MQLGIERRKRIRQRLAPILKEFHSDLQFISVFVDSLRENLGIVVQLDEKPMLLKFGWVDFISSSDNILRQGVFDQLAQKLPSYQQAAC